MTGDFAAFVTVDNDAIQRALQQGMEGQPVAFETLPFGFGLVIEATDAAKAQTLATALGEKLPKLAQDSPEVTISQEEIGGVAVTVLSSPLDVFSDTKVPLDVVIGANEAVFVIATRDAATAIFTDVPSGGLTNVPIFIEAQNYLLDSPTSLWYMDSAGFSSVTTVMGLALFGPIVGQVFDSIVADLESGAVSTLTPEEQKQRDEERQRQMQEQMQAQMQQAQGMIAFLNTLLSSATISTTTVEGGALSRFVLTLAK
jgi:hypothetical protein